MRRKKRTGVVKMPPIEFFESPPLHVRLRPATPVHSSLCPLTASVVPVTEADNSWISPHFAEKVAGAATLSRQRLVVLGSSEHDVVSGKPCNNRSVLSPQRRSVFRPLKFVGETAETAVATRRRVLSSSVARASEGGTSRRGRHSEVERSTDSTVLAQDQSRDVIVERRISSVRIPLAAEVLCKSRDGSVELCGSSFPTTAVQSGLEMMRCERRTAPNEARGDSLELRLIKSANDIVFCENCLTESQLCTEGQLEIDTPDMDWTALDQRKECPVPVKLSDGRQSEVATDSAFDITLNTIESRVARCQLGRKLKSPSRSVIELLSSVVAMTPPPSVEVNCISTVLALDTPVSDYGLTYRQRALVRLRARKETAVT